MVSVNTANTYYVATAGGLSSQVVNQDLSSVAGGDGLYIASPGSFPTRISSNGANYFRDIFFTPNAASGLTSLTVNPASMTGGSTPTGTVTLNAPAPIGGTVVSLSVTNPLAQPHTIQAVNYSGALQADASMVWQSLGPPLFNAVPSGSVVDVSGVPGTTATITNNANLPLQFDVECPADNCGWLGSFNPGADVFWVGGQYLADGFTWAGNGPMTVTFSTPQRGLGFQLQPDELGSFTATMCAFDSANNPLGCAPFSGTSNAQPTQAMFIGIYDDTQEISKVTIDAGGALYPHDFAIGDALVVNGEKQPVTVPATVTVPPGATTATFQVTTNEVSNSTSVIVSATYDTTQTATLTLTPPDLLTLIMNPNGVPGGTSSTGTVTLANPAPSGGAVVMLTNDVPVAQAHTIQPVSFPGAVESNGSVSPSALQADGSISWSTLGAPYSSIPSGVVVPVAGLPGLNATITNSANLPLQYDVECPANNCGWLGNFNPGADILWDGGQYQADGITWVGYGPMTVAFSSPQRGLGFQIMPDELGSFTAKLCAYDSSNTQLGCASFNAAGSLLDQAIPVGIYDDTQEISKVTVDAGGTLYPHDFAIGDMFVTNAARPVVAVVPSSVTVAEGQTTGTFTVTTNAVNTNTFVTITGSYSGTQTSGTLQVTAINPAISAVSVAPTSVGAGNIATGTVTLSSPAVTGGAVVTLSSNNAGVTVPASVTVAAHATTANFNVTASAASGTATITATLNGTATTQVTIVPLATAVSSVSLNPTSIVGGVSGQTATGTVTLNGPAPSAGMVVTLTSGNPAVATVPGSVTVPGNATSTTFTVTPLAVGGSTDVSISANVGATTAQSATLTVEPLVTGVASPLLTVNPPTLSSLTLDPTVVTHPSPSTGTVTISGAAPAGGFLVNLSSSDPSATVDPTMTIAAGQTSGTFTVSTIATGPGTNHQVTITASQTGSSNITAILTVN